MARFGAADVFTSTMPGTWLRHHSKLGALAPQAR
jgi:hypothetical protein